MITRRNALVVLAAPALMLPYRRWLRNAYDNVGHFPYGYNRPFLNRPPQLLVAWFGIRQANAASNTLSWIGPTITGGPSSTNAAGASTTSDVAQSLTLPAATANGVTSSAAGQVFVGLNIVGANTCVTINHPNCKILRSNLQGSGTAAGSYPGVVHLGSSAATGLLIEDSIINGACTTNQQTTGFQTGGGSGPGTPAFTVRRCTIQQIEKGISGGNFNGSSIVDCYFWNFVGGDCDMVQLYNAGANPGGDISGLTVNHNSFDGQNNRYSTFNDSCINVSTYGNPDQLGNNDTSNVIFSNNACGMPASCAHQVLFDMRWMNGSNQSQYGTITNMTVTANAFYGAAGYFSSHLGNSAASGPTFTANAGNYIAGAWPPVLGVGLPINGTGAV